MQFAENYFDDSSFRIFRFNRYVFVILHQISKVGNGWDAIKMELK